MLSPESLYPCVDDIACSAPDFMLYIHTIIFFLCEGGLLPHIRSSPVEPFFFPSTRALSSPRDIFSQSSVK